MELEEIIKFVKSKLSEKRFNHCIGVMNMCEKLAKIYGTDIERAQKIGVTHDMAKEMTHEEDLEYMKENGIKLTDEEKGMPYLFHGYVAAEIARKELGFDDEMCEAIKHHTTSKPNMTILQKILYVADKVEEGRTYSDVNFYRNLAYTDIDECIIKILDYQISEDINNEMTIPSISCASRNYIINNRNSISNA